jgi:serine/threonine protein phosphatase 1
VTPQRIIAIGDIHGCVHALDALLEIIAPSADDLFVVLGDFVDQGYESRLVIDALLALGDKSRLVCLKGNHEEMMLAARDNEPALRYWEMCGGVQTLNSYRFGSKLEEIPAEHMEFIASCRDYYETADHIFVHANFDPALPLARQQPHTLRWELLDPETAHRHITGKTAIVGHTEQKTGEILDLGPVKCIDTACWRCGWLTALDVTSNQLWQASRFGVLREANEPPVGTIGGNL